MRIVLDVGSLKRSLQLLGLLFPESVTSRSTTRAWVTLFRQPEISLVVYESSAPIAKHIISATVAEKNYDEILRACHQEPGLWSEMDQAIGGFSLVDLDGHTWIILANSPTSN